MANEYGDFNMSPQIALAPDLGFQHCRIHKHSWMRNQDTDLRYKHDHSATWVECI